MPFGLLTGLGAALSWGLMDIASALASRRVGSLLVTAGVILVSAVALVAAALLTGTTLPSDVEAWRWATILGVVGAGAYLAYFTGLRVGPISVVSGMVAAYGGLTVILAVVIRGETLTSTQAFGAAIATAGVILTGVAFDGGWRATRFASPGVIFAVAALVLFSLMAISTDVALDHAGWLPVLVIARIVNVALLGAVVLVVTVRARRRHAPVEGPEGQPIPDAGMTHRRVVAAILVAGLLDVTGLVSFAVGLETAPTWLVGLASSFGPAVTILVAVAFLGERLKPIQWFGLAGVAVGMVAIALP